MRVQSRQRYRQQADSDRIAFLAAVRTAKNGDDPWFEDIAVAEVENALDALDDNDLIALADRSSTLSTERLALMCLDLIEQDGA